MVTPNSEAIAEFRRLDEEQKRLENQISALQEYLCADGMPGMTALLVDDQGFPRADLDIYAIRKARNEIACAQTDHVVVMKQIEKCLECIHAGSCVSVPTKSSANVKSNNMDVSSGAQCGISTADLADLLPPAPFALIDDVADGSPAKDAGLAVGDLVSRFGTVNRSDTGDLNACFAAVAKEVQQNVGQPIEVLVLRGPPGSVKGKVALTLTPRQWSGRGLLGCHLAPHVEN